MIVSLSELRDFFRPFHTPGYFWSHTVWHLLGGPAWFGVGLFALHWVALLFKAERTWFSGFAFAFAVVATAIRQGWMREAKGASEFPLWAMLWDTIASTAAAGAVALVVGLLGG